MSVVVTRRGGSLVAVVGALLTAGRASGTFTQTIAPGTREILSLDFASLPVGDFPKRADLQTLSSLEIVDHNGVHMLRAGTRSEFVIRLPENLPDLFTLEFDLVSQECCGSEDFSFEGTTKDPYQNSAKVTWSPTLQKVSGGGGSDFTAATTFAGGQLAHILASIEGTTIKMYTNGVRLYTVSDRRFERGQVLRVSFNGIDEDKGAVYVARFRVAEGAATAVVVTVPASKGAITQGPVSTVQSTNQAPAAPGGSMTAPPPPPPAPPTAPQPNPPIGAGEPPSASPQQAAGTPGSMRIDNTSFTVVMLRGGSVAASVVENRLADGSIKKQLASVVVEPLVFDVAPGSPVDAWLKATLTGSLPMKDGSLFGGVVPAQQELDFHRGFISSVMIPTLDAANTVAAFLRVMVTPEQMLQTSLTGTTSGTSRNWVGSDFRFTMGDLETSRAVRIESFTIKSSITDEATGVQRVAGVTPTGQPEISNLLVSFTEDASFTASNWRGWYDDFVVKGNNDDSHERSFTLELGGFLTGGTASLTLKGYGVGIVALRVLPQPIGSTTRRLQAELYVERMDVCSTNSAEPPCPQ